MKYFRLQLALQICTFMWDKWAVELKSSTAYKKSKHCVWLKIGKSLLKFVSWGTAATLPALLLCESPALNACTHICLN